MSERTGIRAKLAAGAVLLVLAGALVDRIASSSLDTPFLVVAVAVAAAGAVGLSVLVAHVLTRPIRELTRTAQAMAAGDLTVRAPAEGSRELVELSHAVNGLARELSASMRDLRADRDLLASILDGMSDGVLVLDRDGRIVLANPALRSMTMVSADAVGKRLLEAVRSSALEEAIRAAAGQLRRGEASDEAPPERGEIVREIDFGGLLPKRLLVRVSALASPGGDRGLIAVFHDVTELRRLETVRTDFVANVSHELRTPVTAISTATETLKAGALEDRDDAAEFVDVIDRHAKRLRHLVEDLLDLSKIESKTFHLDIKSLDAPAIIAHAVQLIDDHAGRRNVRITMTHGPDLPRARGDRGALEQVLFNLLDNAVKYAGEHARVAVDVAQQGADVVIAVSDTGPGISPQHLGRIFERFYRVDAGRSRELGGTGLGLSIVKHLVESMGGAVEVESELGRGATFRVRLPSDAPNDPGDARGDVSDALNKASDALE